MGFRQAEVPWHFGQAIQRLLDPCMLRGHFIPVFHQFCFLLGVSPVV